MKALCIFSGGLDSLLAAELIRSQGIEVLAFFFETPFFASTKAINSAKTIDLPLKRIDLTREHLEVVKGPKHGYGGNMNPCIDCHCLMLRKAGAMLREEGADFIITGEVLGQRPMSQNRAALSMVAAGSGYERLILRPLSARLLPLTTPEEEGWVDREKLLDFSGRSRKPQIALAQKFNLSAYPAPAGGCLLTDKEFSKRLKDLLASDPHPEGRQLELLKLGRHFRINPRTKIIIGRNREENEKIAALSGTDDLILSPLSIPGPTSLSIGDLSPEIADLAASMTVSYSDAVMGEIIEIRLMGKGGEKKMKALCCEKNEFRRYMI